MNRFWEWLYQQDQIARSLQASLDDANATIARIRAAQEDLEPYPPQIKPPQTDSRGERLPLPVNPKDDGA